MQNLAQNSARNLTHNPTHNLAHIAQNLTHSLTRNLAHITHNSARTLAHITHNLARKFAAITAITTTIILITLTGCKELPECEGSSCPVTNSANLISSNITIASVFPRTPMIAVGGAATLTAVVTNGAGTVLESTSADPIAIVWRSANSSIVRVSESGSIYGVKLGSAQVTAYAIRGNAGSADYTRSADYTISVNVTKRNSSDVAELFFNPMQAYIDMNAERVFRLSAVDHSGTATSLSEGRVYIETSNENVQITPREVNLTATNNAVEIRVRGLQKGFSFITPYYELTSQDRTEKVRVSGTPLVVQIKDSIETNLPNMPAQYYDGGNYLSIAVGETGGYKTIYASHYDKSARGLLSSEFHTAWKHSTIGGGMATLADAGRSNAIALSPFDYSLNLPMIAALKNRKPVLYFQMAIGGSVQEYDLGITAPTADLNDSAHYDNSSRLLSITAFSDQSAARIVHIAYYDDSNLSAPKVCLLSLTNEYTITANTHKCVNTPANSRVHSVSIAHNRSTGEPRMVYGFSAYTDEENSSNNVSEGLFYLSRQGSDLYREQIAISDGNVNFASLAFDRNNKPFVAVREGGYVRVYSREAHLSTNSFRWARDPVAFTEPVQGTIRSVSFAVDSHNEPRLAFSADTGGGLRIYYARKPPFRYLGSRWTIEEPGQNLTSGEHGDQGTSSAIAIDSSNRAHLVYSLATRKWFNYWAEPNFFDYRNFPTAQYTGADLIKGNRL